MWWCGSITFRRCTCVWCLLATSAIMLSEKKKRKRKMWIKKWHLKRNISCDAHLLNEMLETDVPWDDAIVVSAGKQRKLWDSLSELRSYLCERWLERAVLRPALLSVKTAQFRHFKIPTKCTILLIFKSTYVRSPPAYCTAAYRGWRYQRLWWYNWSSWLWAACCSKHVEECSITYVLLKIKRIVH